MNITNFSSKCELANLNYFLFSLQLFFLIVFSFIFNLLKLNFWWIFRNNNFKTIYLKKKASILLVMKLLQFSKQAQLHALHESSTSSSFSALFSASVAFPFKTEWPFWFNGLFSFADLFWRDGGSAVWSSRGVWDEGDSAFCSSRGVWFESTSGQPFSSVGVLDIIKHWVRFDHLINFTV